MRSLAIACLLSSTAAIACVDRAAPDDGGADSVGGSGAGAASEGGSAPTPSPCGETPDAPAFEVGTGEACFEPVADGAVVPRVGGPQGGFHVWGAFLCADCPNKVIVNVGLKLPDSEAWVGEQSERVVEVQSAQVAGLIALLPSTLDNPSSSLPQGSEVRLLVDIKALDGAELYAAERTVTLGELVLWKP